MNYQNKLKNIAVLAKGSKLSRLLNNPNRYISV